MKKTPTRAVLNRQTAELKVYAGSQLVGTHDVFKEGYKKGLPANVACAMSQANALIHRVYGVYVQTWGGWSDLPKSKAEPIATTLGSAPINMD